MVAGATSKYNWRSLMCSYPGQLYALICGRTNLKNSAFGHVKFEHENFFDAFSYAQEAAIVKIVRIIELLFANTVGVYLCCLFRRSIKVNILGDMSTFGEFWSEKSNWSSPL